jgi:peptide/nickel transport system substrate-binding protein
MGKRAEVTGLSLLVCLIVTSCAPSGGTARSDSAPQVSSTGPKRLVAAIQSDPSVLTNTLVISSGQPGVPEIEEMINVGLTDADPNGVRQPYLSEQVPTLDNGLWKLSPDGTMETRWTIRPGAQWHDGTPVTTDDLVFTLQANQDPQLVEFNNPRFRLISRVDAVDTRTLVVHWSAPLIDADALFTRGSSGAGGGFANPLPKHLLERPFQEDRAGYREWAYWTTQFVGTGPYKVKEFARGSHLTLQANDSYVLGRPKIDEIEVKFIPDSTTRLANVLAGAVELTIGRDVTLDQAVEARDSWKEGKAETYPGSWLGIHPQLLNPSPSVVGNVAFRRALLQAIDRQALVDTILHGMSSIPHAWLTPNEPQYWDIHDRVARYDYDPRRAEQQIADLGYTKRGDGSFYDPAGQRLSVEIRTTGDNASHMKAILPIADYWTRLGVATDQVVIPVQRQQDAEYRATYPGFQLLRGTAGTSGMAAVLSSKSGLPENNFRASGNYSRLMDPNYDALYDRYTMTIPLDERKQVVEQAMRFFAEEQIKMGVFYDVAVTMISSRLTNVLPKRVAWASHTWELR